LLQINLRGLDGIQGPVYVGSDCVFNRTVVVSSHHYVVARVVTFVTCKTSKIEWTCFVVELC
jgi:hypothetical protein